MRYKLLGNSGLRVSELSLGTMTFGDDWGWGASKEESRRIFDAYAEAGGNFIDGANIYTGGSSERYIGEFVGSDRDRFVIATKYTMGSHPEFPDSRVTDPNAGGNHRKAMVQALDASLKRLGTDYIDVYWVHVWDVVTPVEEMMRALDDMVRAGKVLYVGVSNAPAWIVSQANTMAHFRDWTPFVGLQVQYSLVDRAPERDLLPMAQALDLALVAWGVIGAGVLSGKYSKRDPTAAKDGGRLSIQSWAEGYLTERNVAIAEEVGRIADEIGRTASQVAINWVTRQRGVMIPIIGATTEAQIRDNLASLDFDLSDEHLRRLDSVSQIELGSPHDFISNDFTKQVVHGETFPLLDNHRARA